ncbi:MAG: hypothetical protein AB7E47_15755 [Desulfovibrionaceae bacterium]
MQRIRKAFLLALTVIAVFTPVLASASNLAEGQEPFFPRRFEDAHVTFDAELQQDTLNPLGQYFRTLTHFKSHRLREAKAGFEATLRLKPGHT